MQRMKDKDIPAYADDIAHSARSIGSQLILGAGILSVLLIAVSAVEAPISSQYPHMDSDRATESGRTFQGLSWLTCLFRDEPIS